MSQADALTKGLSIVAAMELSGVLQQSSPSVHQVSPSWGGKLRLLVLILKGRYTLDH